jgi:hypothetical protein
MKIYENLTFKYTNLKDALDIIKKKKSQRINFFHSFNSLIWQGPYFVKYIDDKLKKKKVNFIVETRENIGLTLALINLGIKHISISVTVDKKILKKISSMAKKKKIDIHITEKFSKIQKLDNFE